MNPFAAIEDACAGFVERTFARIFPSAVTPAQVARKLVATMESTPAETILVQLNPRDLAGLGAPSAELETEWTALLGRTATALDLTLARPIRVVVHADENVVAGTVAVDPVVDDEEAAAVRGYALHVVAGLPAGAVFPVAGTLTIGRGRENTIDLVDLRVSRRHAQVVADEHGIAAEDLGSTNGTYLNGERLSGMKRAEAGDTLKIGDTVLRVEIADG